MKSHVQVILVPDNSHDAKLLQQPTLLWHTDSLATIVESARYIGHYRSQRLNVVGSACVQLNYSVRDEGSLGGYFNPIPGGFSLIFIDFH